MAVVRKKVPVPGKKRIRKDESYEKNYLIGKYGAIPTLKSIDFFKSAGCPGDTCLAPTGVERRD